MASKTDNGAGQGSARLREVTIKRVSDLVALSDAELLACLTALRQELVNKRWVHEAAVASGAVAEGTPFSFDKFVWRPVSRHGARKTRVQVVADSPIADLPLPRRALESLSAHGYGVLRDLVAASERELLGYQDMGPKTVEALRQLLQEVGLDFAVASDPSELRRNQALQQLDRKQLRAARAQLGDDAPASRLGLYPRTLNVALKAGWTTVGALRAAALADLAQTLGRASLREVLRALEDTGGGLGPTHTPLELWRVGALAINDLVRPQDPQTPVAELEPWLGSTTKALAAVGVRSLGDLVQASERGRLAGATKLLPRDLSAVKAFLSQRAELVGG